MRNRLICEELTKVALKYLMYYVRFFINFNTREFLGDYIIKAVDTSPAGRDQSYKGKALMVEGSVV